LDWFWIGFGSVAIPIYQSLNNHLFAIHLPYINKGIWHIFWKQMTEISRPKPIQNQFKTNPKPIQNQLKNNSKMNYKLNSWELESKWSRSFNIK